jgi:hypothetical protein
MGTEPKNSLIKKAFTNPAHSIGACATVPPLS